MCCRRIFTLILSISIAALSIYSQTSTGEINGTVTDSAGAAVPGAAVRLVSEETKIETATATNADGYFRFVNVKPGNYTVAIEMQGFKRTITAPFTLAVSETSTQNITLQVGNVAETVEISGGSEVLQTTTTELGTVISEIEFKEITIIIRISSPAGQTNRSFRNG